MSWKKTIPEKEVTVDIEAVVITKNGDLRVVYREGNQRKSKSVSVFDLSDNTKQQLEDIVYDSIKHNLVEDVDSFEFEKQEETSN